jgi:pimeloyl-ACP methyl ester carboxylesterase
VRIAIVKVRSLLLLLAVFLVLYFGVAIYVLHFQLESSLLPRVALPRGTSEQSMHHVSGQSGNVMLVRRYGVPEVGCVVFFPGQHGGISLYEKNLFPAYVANGFAVFALAYPGQDGAPGRSDLSEVQPLVQQALTIVGNTCPPAKTIFVGRSLGSMLAAYAAGAIQPAGLILEGAAPSLSSAVLVRLRSHWYLAPLAHLPVSKILAHDYSLTNALSSSPKLPIVIFQGTADDQSPISALRTIGSLPQNAHLVAVQGGTHSNTFLLAGESIVQTALRMVRRRT